MKLPPISGRGLIKILNKVDFVVIRQKGSHVRLEKITLEEVIKITVPMHNQLKRGTLNQIIKDCKISEEDFLKYI